MKIAFLHYHLKPGGVTTVIKQQINAVKGDCEILVISGQAPENNFPFKTVVIPEIGYNPPRTQQPSPEKTANKITNAISDYWQSGCDVLHVHNPLLAKNSQFLKILSVLFEKNIRLFLQIHDFAEDGRPWVYYADESYPSDCHFGVINSRDFDILLKSGLKRSGLHLLLNMVTPFNIEPEKKISSDIVLYPVRAIRRKNIGEAIFLSLFFQKNEDLAVTLPPNSPRDWKHYNGWKQFAVKNKLNIIFEASDTYDFTDLVKSATTMITTSISEGFGFSYLEPWTAGQMLTGRILPEICMDFTQKGMRLDHLYEKIFIPIKTIDIDLFYKKWKSCILDNAAKFRISISDDAIAKAYEILTSNQYIDFAIFDEHLQKQVIVKILSNKKFKNRVMRLNPFLLNFSRIQNPDAKIQHNRLIVETEFNQSGYRKRLLDTYQKVIQKKVIHNIDKQILAKKFLNPKNFSLLKWSDPHV